MEMASSSRSGSAFGSDLAGDAGLSFDGAAKVDQEDIGSRIDGNCSREEEVVESLACRGYDLNK